MGARIKLNQAHATGALLFAGALGGLTGSWLVFTAAAGLGLFLGYIGGDLRGRPR
jgi:hypothetical protein